MSRLFGLRSRGGFTLLEIMIVVLIIGVLLSIAIPGFARARNTARARSCLTNMRQIEAAKVQYSIEYCRAFGYSVSMDDLVPMYIKDDPVCPAGGDYDPKTVGEDVTCSVDGHQL